MKKILLLFIFLILAGPIYSVSGLTFLHKKSGIFYVNDAVILNGTGHRWWPHGDLVKSIALIEKRTSEDRMLHFSGSYSGDLTFPENIHLQNADNATFTGTIELRGDSKVHGGTFTGAGHGIVIREGASVELQNISVRDNAENGVHTLFNTSVVMHESIVKENTKGFYIQNGSTFSLENSTVEQNREEGIDLRENVSADITHTTIKNNGESGIEFILGGSSGTFAGNDISDNLKSGIALQFDKVNTDLGNVTIEHNIIKNNAIFGIKCDQTRSGKKPTGYFRNSITVGENTFESNGNKSVAKKCL